MVQKSLLGPIGLFTKFSTLQEYGVDKLFVVENTHVETTQKNICFLARGEKPKEVQAVAGMCLSIIGILKRACRFSPLYMLSLEPYISTIGPPMRSATRVQSRLQVSLTKYRVDQANTAGITE